MIQFVIAVALFVESSHRIMSTARTTLRELIATDIREHYPQNVDKVDAVVDRLLEMPQLQSDDNVIQFINSYRRAVERRNSGILGQASSS